MYVYVSVQPLLRCNKLVQLYETMKNLKIQNTVRPSSERLSPHHHKIGIFCKKVSTQILFVWQEKGSPHAPHLNQSKRVQIYENAREKYPLNHIGNVLNGQNRERGGWCS